MTPAEIADLMARLDALMAPALDDLSETLPPLKRPLTARSDGKQRLSYHAEQAARMREQPPFRRP